LFGKFARETWERERAMPKAKHRGCNEILPETVLEELIAVLRATNQSGTPDAAFGAHLMAVGYTMIVHSVGRNAGDSFVAQQVSDWIRDGHGVT
jgi:hypothetical protein